MYIRLGGGVGLKDTATPLRPSTPRVGVVGAGYWGPNLIRNLAELPGSPLAAVADANPTRLDYIRARYPAVALYDAGATLFNAQGIDAVVIATPAETHYALAREALLAGKHVFVEKPEPSAMSTTSTRGASTSGRSGRTSMSSGTSPRMTSASWGSFSMPGRAVSVAPGTPTSRTVSKTWHS